MITYRFTNVSRSITKASPHLFIFLKLCIGGETFQMHNKLGKLNVV